MILERWCDRTPNGKNTKKTWANKARRGWCHVLL